MVDDRTRMLLPSTKSHMGKTYTTFHKKERNKQENVKNPTPYSAFVEKYHQHVFLEDRTRGGFFIIKRLHHKEITIDILCACACVLMCIYVYFTVMLQEGF